MADSSPSGGTTTATSVTTWLIRLVAGMTVPTGARAISGVELIAPGSSCGPIRIIRADASGPPRGTNKQ